MTFVFYLETFSWAFPLLQEETWHLFPRGENVASTFFTWPPPYPQPCLPGITWSPPYPQPCLPGITWLPSHPQPYLPGITWPPSHPQPCLAGTYYLAAFWSPALSSRYYLAASSSPALSASITWLPPFWLRLHPQPRLPGRTCWAEFSPAGPPQNSSSPNQSPKILITCLYNSIAGPGDFVSCGYPPFCRLWVSSILSASGILHFVGSGYAPFWRLRVPPFWRLHD